MLRVAGLLAGAVLVAACGASAPSLAPVSTTGAAATQSAPAPLATLDLQATISDLGGAVSLVATDDVVWVLDHSSAAVRRIDPETNTVTATVDLGDGFATGLGLAGSRLWTFHQTEGSVVGINPATGGIDAIIKAGADGDWFFVGEDAAWLISGGNLVRIDAATEAVTQYPLDATCFVEGAAAGGGYVWVASRSGSICKIDPATGKVVAHGAGGGKGAGMAIVGGNPWVPGNDDGVSIVDPTALTVATAVPPPAPGSYQGSTYSLGSAGDNNVLAGDAAGTGGWVRYTGATLGRVVLSGSPAITLYAGFPADLLPGGVVEAFGSLWVANFGAGTVTRHAIPGA